MFGTESRGGINFYRQFGGFWGLFFMYAVNKKIFNLYRCKLNDIVFEPVFAGQQFFAEFGQFYAAGGGLFLEVAGIEVFAGITDGNFLSVVIIVAGDDLKIFFQKFFQKRRCGFLCGKNYLPAASGVVHVIPYFQFVVY